MKKEGISLITLIITIIVIIILAGTVIFSLSKNNVIGRANEAVFKSDLSAFQEELEMYKLNNITKTSGKYDESALDADKVSATYDGTNIEGISNILGIITKMSSKEEYTEILAIQKGELIYIGTDETKKEWAETVGIYGKYKDVSIAEEINKTKVKAGTEVVYTLTVSSQYEITSIDLTGKLVLVDITKNEEIANSTEIITIGEIEQVSEKEKKVEITVKTDELENGKYALKILKEIAVDKNNMTNSKDKIVESFEINTIVYEDITLTPSTTEWTNKNITVTITYPEGMTEKKYKIGTDEEFKNYTGPFEVEENTLVIATGTDVLGNSTKSPATLTISKIDKTKPTITLSEVSKTTSSVTVKAIASDSESGLNTSSYEYSKDNGATWTASTSNTTYTFNNLISGTYSIKARVKDKATNEGVSAGISVATTGIDTLESGIKLTANTTSPTNQNVTVTITYPTGLTVKEYKIGINGEWDVYTKAVVVESNNTVYARGKDVAGNTTKGSPTITVTNIDKVVPSVSFSPNGGSTTSSSISTKVSVTDSGSGVKTVQYAWSGSTSTPTSWTTISNNSSTSISSNGTWYVYVKATDNAGNETITRSNSFTVNYTYVPPTPQCESEGDSAYNTEYNRCMREDSAPTCGPDTPSGACQAPTKEYMCNSKGNSAKAAAIQSCYRAVDSTPPTINSVSVSTTKNSIKATVSASDTSGIKEYAFKMSNDGYWRSQTGNTYTFTGLSTETQYTIDIRVTDKAGLTTTISRTVSTDSLSKSEKCSQQASNAQSSCTAPPGSGGCSGIYDMVYKSCMNN